MCDRIELFVKECVELRGGYRGKGIERSSWIDYAVEPVGWCAGIWNDDSCIVGSFMYLCGIIVNKHCSSALEWVYYNYIYHK